jgi:hypothetical protein
METDMAAANTLAGNSEAHSVKFIDSKKQNFALLSCKSIYLACNSLIRREVTYIVIKPIFSRGKQNLFSTEVFLRRSCY